MLSTSSEGAVPGRTTALTSFMSVLMTFAFVPARAAITAASALASTAHSALWLPSAFLADENEILQPARLAADFGE
jgi:hypothetical protein